MIGLKSHINTDHKPLIPLFSTKHLDELPGRVQRFRLRMMRFEFSISGKELLIADALSRAPATDPTPADLLLQQEADAYVSMVLQGLPATEALRDQARRTTSRARRSSSTARTSGRTSEQLMHVFFPTTQ